MIRQKYESISQSDYSCENQLVGTTQHQDNVGDYLNFGEEMNHGHNNPLENFDNMNGVKQEEIECDYLQSTLQKNQIEHGQGFDQPSLPFLQTLNSNLIGEPSYFIYKQQSIISANSNAIPITGAGHSATLQQVDNSQLSAKMKRIMKREKAKSRRKLNLEQQQQQQSIVIDSQYKGSIPTISNQIPALYQQPIHNLEDQNLFYKKSGEYNANNQKFETRSSSLSCSSNNNVQINVKIESPSMDICGSSVSNGNINSSNQLEQSLKLNTIQNNEDLQLKTLSQQCTGGVEQKQQKKVMQMIRNRISAQNSRDRKKAYITKLEQEKNEIFLENIDLSDQLNQTKKELANEKCKNETILKEIQELKKKLQSQHQSSNTNSEIIDLTSYQKNSISNQKNYSAFNVALFALLGVVLIFNAKPNKNEQDSINQSSQMIKMLDDLSKSTSEKMASMKNQKDELTLVNSSDINDKKYQKEEICIQIDEDTQQNSMEEESPSPGEQSATFSLFSKQSQSDQIQKDQWVQFIVPKQDNQNLRDDVSRDSAETDITHNSSSKYLQVWAQIKSVKEFEQAN